MHLKQTSPSSIYLIRHGETEWSLSGKHTGKTDISLTIKGIAQAKMLKTRLTNHVFTHVFVSPRKRALLTCELAGLSEKAIIEPDLAEWNYGDYEGLTTPQILETNPSWNIFSNGAPNGESPKEMSIRMNRLLLKLESLQGNIALIAHGHCLRAFTTSWLQLPLEAGKHFILNPASLSILGYEHANRALQLWNVC